MPSLALPLFFAACAVPPPSAYVSTKATRHVANVPLGTNAAGESCTQDSGPGENSASVYCGTWQQPSAHVAAASFQAASLAGVASNSPWREELDHRLDCTDQSSAEVLGRYPAILLKCTTRLGGWPQVALVANVGGRIWLADGVLPALPAVERSIGVLSGVVAPNAIAAQPVSAGLSAQRLAAQAFSSGDIGQYQELIRLANRSNMSGNYSDSENAFRSASALQERVQGHESPALARTLAGEALQLSNQGRFEEAAALFERAEALARSPKQSDDAALPQVLHYRGLHLLNEGETESALAMLRQAEAAYTALLPASSLSASADKGIGNSLDNQLLFNDDIERRALLGVIETRRAEARALRLLGRNGESATLADSASGLADVRGVDEPQMTARLYRTSAFIDDAAGRHQAALSSFSLSAAAYGRAVPNSPTFAETELLFAGRLAADGDSQKALAVCRDAAQVLRSTNSGTNGEWLQPCMTLLNADAIAAPDRAQAVWSEMFTFGQLARSSITSQQIAQASARLSENARDPKVAALIRSQDDIKTQLADLYQQRDDLRSATDAASQKAGADLDAKITATLAKQAETDSAMQAASPNYGQLVQQVVGAADVFAALHPGEAFAATALSHAAGWTFLLRDGKITVAPIEGGSEELAALIKRVRGSLDAEIEPPPPFDTQAAEKLYDIVLRGVAPAMNGATALSVAPSGPLLSLPFGMLLTGHAEQTDLAGAPWLIKQLTIEHVPAPANFISLRKLAEKSRATRPWFGFGDFHPVTEAQAEKSFPAAACADSAKLLAALPPLPGAQVELNAVRQLEGAPTSDELTGAAFTAANVQKAALKDVRVLHFATHALLPTDLRCQNEPALVTSPPPGSKDATGALLTASQVAGMDLDADAVVLSACNTGGAGGATSGESLTGLARSFFFAGARALLVTHWSVNDRTTAYLVALTLAGSKKDPGLGLAGALAAAQRRILSDAKGDVAVQAHPFYWAALAVIGEGMGNRRAGT